MSARDARPGTDRTRATARRGTAPASPGSPPASGDRLIVGTVPPLVPVTGLLLLLSGLAGALAVVPAYLTVDGQELRQVRGLGSALVALLVPVVQAAVGTTLLRRRVPKFGLAYAGVAGALGVGQLLIEAYRGVSSTSRPGVEVLAGEVVLTSGIEIGAGWVLGVVALLLTVAAAVTGTAAWGRTVMEDRGPLDPVRSSLAGATVLLGVATVICLTVPAADVPDQLRTDPATGMQTVVAQEGPQALLERPGLALLGGLLLAGALLLCSVVVPSLRPRLALVGGLLALTVTVLAAGLGGLEDAASSDGLEWTVAGIGLLALGPAYVLLTLGAWRARRSGG